MPGPDEIRHYQQEHRSNLAERLLQAVIPAVKLDPMAMRRRLAERFQEADQGPGPDKDYPYIKDTAP